jgi:membrane dipeptidase
VGLGSDFDGISAVPKGLEDVSKFPDLVAELLRLGWKKQELVKLLSGNALRVMHQAEAIAQR